jgi:hypothetical protein
MRIFLFGGEAMLRFPARIYLRNVEGEPNVASKCHLENGGNQTTIATIVNTEELALLEQNLCRLKGALEQRQVHVRRFVAQLAVNLAKGTAT